MKLPRQIFIFWMIVFFIMGVTFAQKTTWKQEAEDRRVQDQLRRFEDIKQRGGEYATLLFLVQKYFWDSKNYSTISDSTENDHSLIAAAGEHGLNVIGTASVWGFPPFAKATLEPFKGEVDSSVSRLPCVPDIGSDEYLRLASARDGMWNRMAAEFSEVDLWVIGFEPRLNFKNCKGEQLNLTDMVAFINDTYKRISETIKNANPKASTYRHFMGRSHRPIYVDREIVQPTELLAKLDSIHSEEHYSIIEPDLTNDRVPEPPILLRSTGGSRSMSWSTPPWEVNFTTSEGYGHWSDLVSSSSDWEDILTSSNKIDISVDPDEASPYEDLSGIAYSELGTQTQISAAVAMANDDDYVPTSCLDSNPGGDKRNWWVTVSDFYASTDPTSTPTSHTGACLRVRPDTNQNSFTRFCGIMHIDNVSTPCGNTDPCGGLQLTGKNAITGSITGPVYYADLTRAPADYNSHLFRAQIHEREYDHPTRGWELEWAAEWWDLGTQPDNDEEVFLGDFEYGFEDLNWISEYELISSYLVVEPYRPGSRTLFGLAYGKNGGIGTVRVATTCLQF